MTREEYETLKALQFGLLIDSPWPVWLALINQGFIGKPAYLREHRVALRELVVTSVGETALRWYQ